MTTWTPLKAGETIAAPNDTIIMAGDVLRPDSLWIVTKETDREEGIEVAMAFLPPGVRLCREMDANRDTRGIMFEGPRALGSDRRLLIGGETFNLRFDDLNLNVDFSPVYEDGRWVIKVDFGPIHKFVEKATDDRNQPL